MSRADQAFEEDDNAFVKDQFNEKAARACYKMCCEPKAAQYLAEIVPPEPEPKESFGRPAKTDNTCDITEALAFL